MELDKSTMAPAQSTQPAASSASQGSSKLKSKKVLLIGAGLLLVVVIVLGMIFSGSSNKAIDKIKQTNTGSTTEEGIETVKKNTQSSSTAKASSHLVVYGAWTGQASVIKAVDLSNSNNLLLATLPLEVKKVSVLTDKTLLYIDQIDKQDHGKNIVVYNMKDKKVATTIPASDGFVIDDYFLSPDKKYIAIWEVKLAQGSQVLQGGQSRVYSVNIANPTTKNLLYDEQINSSTPVHYPRAVLNNGTVFADTFMANDPRGGAGWANGMSVVSFDGTSKKDIGSMKAGTYGTQPSLSIDGKYLLFSGYDGSKGDGNKVVNGYRQALLTPNTVELLNTQTLQRFKFPNLENTRSYTASSWDQITGNVILTSLSKDPKQTGIFAYDLAARTATKLAMPNSSGEPYGYVSQLPGKKMLLATSDDKESNLGNLGDNYAYALTQVAVLDPKGTLSKLAVEDSFMQYITILPGTYFNSVLGTKTMAQAYTIEPTIIDLYSDQNGSKQNLQLYTFFLKAQLAPTRLKQQVESPNVTPNPDGSTPTCRELAEQQCQAQGIKEDILSDEYNDCVKTNKDANKAKKDEGICHDSPLYLYGAEGKQVRVAIQTPVYNASPASAGEYAITLGAKGDMKINGKAYQSIAYDYNSNLRRITPPTQGAVVKKVDVEKVLRKYATKLGLNEKETADLVEAGKKKVTSPYAFISFFDHKTSQEILPIAFSPKPDNYLNVVFYFKLLESKPSVMPEAPVFQQPLNRSGYTAVEVSEIVE